MPIREQLTLRDLGERRIIQELIAPRFPAVGDNITGIGDDCAIIHAVSPDECLVMTTDPCPTPVSCIIGPIDYYHYGRLTALINVSDLAAMGATPVGLLVSTVMTEDMKVIDYERFLEGLAVACDEWHCPVIGGNIKDGSSFTANGSALGTVRRDCVMKRWGAQPGDKICVIGEMGLFWAAVLSKKFGLTLNKAVQETLNDALYKPIAKIIEGIALAQTKQVTACMDSSDGISGCLYELAIVNNVDIVIEAELLQPHPAVQLIAEASKIESSKLMLSWGGWELVCSVRNQATHELSQLVASLGGRFSVIGDAREGTGKVLINDVNRTGPLANLASERFCPTSMFTHGIDAYLDFLRSVPLIGS